MNHPTIRPTRALGVAVAGMAVGLAATFAVANGAETESSPDSYQPAERAAVAEWATAQHLSGLSPASLSPRRSSEDPWTTRAAELEAIADYAREHGLSGLSPASLRPTGD